LLFIYAIKSVNLWFFLFRHSIPYFRPGGPSSQLVFNFYLIVFLSPALCFTSLVFAEVVRPQFSYTDFIDFALRSHLNDFFINSYYVLWSNFWYLPTFTLSLFLCLRLSRLRLPSGPVSLIALLSLYHLTLIYAHLQCPTLNFSSQGDFFNNLLSNSINKFHPLLFYIAILPWLRGGQYSPRRRVQRYVHGLRILAHQRGWPSLTFLIVFTLYLGSWWALQEGSWGGWWNWDPSEVFGLAIMIFYLYASHSRASRQRTTDLVNIQRLSCALLAFIYFFIQLNFDLVSHNFGTRVNYFTDPSRSLFITLILTLNAGLFWFAQQEVLNRLAGQVRPNDALHTLNTLQKVWYVFLATFLMSIYLASFSLLINDFAWQWFGVNIINEGLYAGYYAAAAACLILTLNWNLSAPLYMLKFLYLLGYVKLLLLTTSFTWLLAGQLHFFLTQILVIFLYSHTQVYSVWLNLTSLEPCARQGSVVELAGSYLSLNGAYSELSTWFLRTGGDVVSAWTFSKAGLGSETHRFVHTLEFDSFDQILVSGSSTAPYLVNVTDLSLAALSFLVIVLTYLARQVIVRKLVILF
jgi:hypothetical protein